MSMFGKVDISLRRQRPSEEMDMTRRIALGCDLLRISPHRVLRGLSRGRPLSVERECAGRDAACVKGSSPMMLILSWWPSESSDRASSRSYRKTVGTTGFIDHGLYTRLRSERWRDLWGGAQRRQCLTADERGVSAKSEVSAQGEVSSRPCSEKVG